MLVSTQIPEVLIKWRLTQQVWVEPRLGRDKLQDDVMLSVHEPHFGHQGAHPHLSGLSFLSSDIEWIQLSQLWHSSHSLVILST